MENLLFALIGIGFLIVFIGSIFLLVASFSESIGWGLANMFIPFAVILFVCLHWKRAQASMYLWFIGGAMVFMAGSLHADVFGSRGSSATGQARDVVAPPPAYSTLLGEGLFGSGFHFSWNGANYLACSLHQFDGKQPSTMGSMDFDGPIAITGQVRRQEDVQILSYDSSQLDAVTPLPYDPAAEVKAGDPVYIYDFDEAHLGFIQRIRFGGKNASVRVNEPFPAAGNSGSPVVSAVTGTVIGVMLTADDPEGARSIGIELLSPE